MTTDERVAISARANSPLRDKVLEDFAKVGISKTKIYEAIGKL
jgi:hypothetical protein